MGNSFGISEQNLTAELRSICVQDGEKYKETDEIKYKTARIFQQLASIYEKKGPQKISMIRTATLLNASIARQPNDQAKHQLDLFCHYVLRSANAAKCQADLRDISYEVSKRVTVMRNEVKLGLSTLKIIAYDLPDQDRNLLEIQKINDVKRIQNQITNRYKEIMAFVSHKCIDIMGSPPCRYAVVGMGSLARKEITPYSDFEHVIVLDESIRKVKNNNQKRYQTILEYFRWFSVIFQIIIINLRETIIPSVAIPCLNDFSQPGGDWFFDVVTTRGISFDGLMPHACKLPLGRTVKTNQKPWTTELIKPIAEMIDFLEPAQSIKNGYCLGDILTKTCFVSGDLAIYTEFSKQVKACLHNNKLSNCMLIMKQLNDDLKNFDTFHNLKGLQAASNCNIKRVIYRSTTLFISALGRLHMIDASSCFDIVDELLVQGIISTETAHRLSYAVAVACQARLQVYMSSCGQSDDIRSDAFYHTDSNNITSKLLDIVGERSLVDHFVTAFTLQEAIKKEGFCKSLKPDLVDKPSCLFMVLNLLQLYDRVFHEWDHLPKDTTDLSTGDGLMIGFRVAEAHWMKHNFHEALEMYKWLDGHDIGDPIIKSYVKVDVGLCLYETGRYDDALKFSDRAKRKVKALNLAIDLKSYQLGTLASVRGNTFFELEQYKKALCAYKEVSEYIAHDKNDRFAEIDKADNLCNLGHCLMKLQKPEEALSKLKEALEIYNKVKAPVSDVCECYNLLGSCHLARSNHEEALYYFQKFVSLKLKFVNADEEQCEDIKHAKNHIHEIKQILSANHN